MGTELRRRVMDGSAVHDAASIVSSARLEELYECSALLRRTRLRAEEIVDEARELLVEAERQGDPGRILALNAQLDEARSAYCRVLDAYVTICRRINDERQTLLQGLSGVA